MEVAERADDKESGNVLMTFSEEEIDEDLAAFQEDEMVQQALHRGVDLRRYGRELESELRTVLFFIYRLYNYVFSILFIINTKFTSILFFYCK